MMLAKESSELNQPAGTVPSAVASPTWAVDPYDADAPDHRIGNADRDVEYDHRDQRQRAAPLGGGQRRASGRGSARGGRFGQISLTGEVDHQRKHHQPRGERETGVPAIDFRRR